LEAAHDLAGVGRQAKAPSLTCVMFLGEAPAHISRDGVSRAMRPVLLASALNSVGLARSRHAEAVL
jgi:hypothetical protein